jgi:5-methyltetrahydropteroyltriglutamate--homocysteine methyltransferase
VQEQAGLDLLCDGMLGWQDLFRPLAEGVDGLDARPLTRFLDTNTFYRAVLVDREPQLRAPLPPPDLPAGRWLGTLPSPYAFARAADGRVSAQAVAADVLAKQIEAWGEAGCALIVLSEPFLAREGEAGEAIRALEELPDAVPLALQLVFGDASRLLDELADAPLAAVGVDFYLMAADAIPEDYPKEILAGVVDSRSSALEDAPEIARFVEQLQQRNPAGISLVPNGDLQFVSEKIAREKLVRLGRARRAVGEAVPA